MVPGGPWAPVSPESVKRFEVPAQYQKVSSQVKVSEGRMDWRQILCKTNATPSTITALQNALQKNGYYDGPIDGVVGPRTVSAVGRYQQAEKIAEGGLTLETLERLGVRSR